MTTSSSSTTLTTSSCGGAGVLWCVGRACGERCCAASRAAGSAGDACARWGGGAACGCGAPSTPRGAATAGRGASWHGPPVSSQRRAMVRSDGSQQAGGHGTPMGGLLAGCGAVPRQPHVCAASRVAQKWPPAQPSVADSRVRSSALPFCARAAAGGCMEALCPHHCVGIIAAL